LEIHLEKREDMNITILEDQKTIHDPPIDSNDVHENKYFNLMIAMAELVNVIDKQEKDREKDSNSREKVISQYVEGIQSILLLGEEFGFKTEWLEDYAHQKVSGELSNHLMQVLEAIVLLRVKKSVVMYKALFMQYLQLGKLLGVEFEEIAEKFNIE